MKTLAIASIKFYQKFLTKLVVSNCRFEPSCSNYSIDAITRYGIIKGSFMGLKRILRCNPMFVGGIDPVK